MRKLAIISAAIVLLILIGGGGAYYYYFIKGHSSSGTAAAQKSPQKPSFVSLKSMVVNLHSSGKSSYRGSTYLQVGFKFATTNSKAIKVFNNIKPAIRGNVMDLMLKQPIAVTQNESARKKMKSQVLKTVNQTIAHQLGEKKKAPGFNRVYLTRFVTQSQ